VIETLHCKMVDFVRVERALNLFYLIYRLQLSTNAVDTFLENNLCWLGKYSEEEEAVY